MSSNNVRKTLCAKKVMTRNAAKTYIAKNHRNNRNASGNARTAYEHVTAAWKDRDFDWAALRCNSPAAAAPAAPVAAPPVPSAPTNLVPRANVPPVPRMNVVVPAVNGKYASAQNVLRNSFLTAASSRLSNSQIRVDLGIKIKKPHHPLVNTYYSERTDRSEKPYNFLTRRSNLWRGKGPANFPKAGGRRRTRRSA
jgi:hypothetical protein